MAKDYDRQYEKGQSVEDMIQSEGWEVVSKEVEGEVARIERELEGMKDVSRLVSEGMTSEQIVVGIAELQARAKGSKFVLEAVERWRKLRQKALKKL